MFGGTQFICGVLTAEFCFSVLVALSVTILLKHNKVMGIAFLFSPSARCYTKLSPLPLPFCHVLTRFPQSVIKMPTSAGHQVLFGCAYKFQMIQVT